MDIGAFLFLFLLALLIFLVLKQLWIRRHFPPGPLSLPLIGNLWALGITLHKDTFSKLAKQYGNMYTLWLGNQPLVVLSGFKTVKECFSEQSKLSDRKPSALIMILGKGRGIVSSNGHTWKQQRHIGNVCLRLLGMGEKNIEHQIEDLAKQLVEMFAHTKGQPFDPSLPLINSVANVVCSLSFGHQFDLEDKNFQKLVEEANFLEKISGGFFHLMFEAVPWLMKRLPGPYQKVLNAAEFILSFARQEIEKHRQHYSLREPEDFIDYYLLEMEKSKNDSNSTYNEENLACCLLDFFIAGTNTTISSLNWALLTLVNHPEIQEKVHKEIEDVFGSSGSISYRDRKALPYTNAVIHEILRAKYNILIALPRQSTKNVKMGNFHIPKGTIILPDLRSVLLDPEEWETPEEFNPNHFLDKEGNFRFREAFLPFGVGRRICLAEKLARVEIFIFLINLLRAFRFQLPEGMKEIDETPIASMVLHPHPYKICAVPHRSSL